MTTAAPLLDRLAGAGGYAADLTVTEGLAPGEVLDGVALEGCRSERAVFAGSGAWTRSGRSGCSRGWASSPRDEARRQQPGSVAPGDTPRTADTPSRL